jgi:phospholipid transport system substrate-binding protein
MTRTMFRTWGWGALLILTVALAGPNAAHADISENAKAFITKLSDEVIEQLTDPNLPLELQEERFKGIVAKYIAFKSISRWVLGQRHWKRASEEQRMEYMRLYGDLMVATYAHRFQGYSGEELKVTKARVIDANQALVESQISREGAGKPLVINWRVRGAEGKYRIIDIMVEGLSMSQTQRSEFKSFMRSNGGDMDALLANLKERLQKARSDRQLAQKGTPQ